MFGNLFKKKEPKQAISEAPKEASANASAIDEANLKEQAAALTHQIEQTAEDKEKRHLLYNQLGAVEAQLGHDLAAIAAYEESLKDKEEFGDALLNLYETQRKAAAKAKNDDDIQKWVNKTDALLDMSKRVMRSGFGY